MVSIGEKTTSSSLLIYCSEPPRFTCPPCLEFSVRVKNSRRLNVFMHIHIYVSVCVHLHDTYRSVLGRLGAWLPDCSGCTSPGRSRPVRDIGQIWACLYTGKETTTQSMNQWEANKINLHSPVTSVGSMLWIYTETGLYKFLYMTPWRKMGNVVGKFIALNNTQMKTHSVHSKQPDEQSLHTLIQVSPIY